MKFSATEYTREDGLQAIVFQKHWVVRRADGICQFYQPVFKNWVPAHTL